MHGGGRGDVLEGVDELVLVDFGGWDVLAQDLVEDCLFVGHGWGDWKI